MNLSTNVFLYRLSSLHEARFGAGMGVESVSFSISTSTEKNTSPAEFTEIKGWLEGVNTFAEISELSDIEKVDASGWLTNQRSILSTLKQTEKPVVFLIETSSLDELTEVKHQMHELKPSVDRFLISYSGEVDSNTGRSGVRLQLDSAGIRRSLRPG